MGMQIKKIKRGGIFREYGEALFLALLLAFVVRSFVIEPYKIPSKSMVPTLLVGDHIFVNKFIFGLRWPGTTKWMAKFGEPKRGEVIVFIYPEDTSLDFIKRVVGLPGDKISLKEGQLFVNGEPVLQSDIVIDGIDPEDERRLLVHPDSLASLPVSLQTIPYFKEYKNFQIKQENLTGYQHLIQRNRLVPQNDTIMIKVPEGHYFVMGDNRDHSADSRVWGFVPRENLKGKAMFIWLSLDNDLGGVRYRRFGDLIH